MSNFKSRLETEQSELKNKLEKLGEFLDLPIFNNLSEEQKSLLKIQYGSMSTYLMVLNRRLEII